MMADHKKAAQELLDSYDAFMAAEDMDAERMEHCNAVCAAISFGAAAFVRGMGCQAGHAMGRAFLLALIDPLHPDLDYLRESPESGEVARLARGDLDVIVAKTKEGGE